MAPVWAVTGDQVDVVREDLNLHSRQFYPVDRQFHLLETAVHQALREWDMEAAVEANTVQAATTDLTITNPGAP